MTSTERRPGARLRIGPDGSGLLPTCSYLRARDRFAPLRGIGGSVAARLADFSGPATSDAVAAEGLVSVIEACSDECLTGELLLIEEPELLLTPQAQRYLYRLLRRFAAGGNQVMYSTRSLAFVDAAHHDEIVRLDLSGGRRSLSRTSPDALSDAKRVRLTAEFDHERSEMFFARPLSWWRGRPSACRCPSSSGPSATIRTRRASPSSRWAASRTFRWQPGCFGSSRSRSSPCSMPTAVRHQPFSTRRFSELRTGHRSSGSSPDFEATAGLRSHDDKVLHAWRRFAPASAADVPADLARIVNSAVRLLRTPDHTRSHDVGRPAAPQGQALYGGRHV